MMAQSFAPGRPRERISRRFSRMQPKCVSGQRRAEISLLLALCPPSFFILIRSVDGLRAEQIRCATAAVGPSARELQDPGDVLQRRLRERRHLAISQAPSRRRRPSRSRTLGPAPRPERG
jgi:hypothetical protein